MERVTDNVELNFPARMADGRQFTDMDESQAQSLLKKFDNILLLQQWITIDKRPDHHEDWLNILFQKQN